MDKINQIAYDYAQAIKHQTICEQELGKALSALGSDNYLITVSEPIRTSYSKLVHDTIGAEMFEWLEYWMYECDFGTKDYEVTINGNTLVVSYTTLFNFLEFVK